MNSRLPTLMEVLHPRCFASNPMRAKATRTIVQPDDDAFELAEAGASREWRSAASSGQAAASRMS